MPRVAHFEIHAQNPAKAAEYYGNLFGWKMQHLAHIDYWLIDTADGTRSFCKPNSSHFVASMDAAR